MTDYLDTSLSGWYFHVDLDRGDIDKHLTPPGCKPASELTHESIQANTIYGEYFMLICLTDAD